MMLSKHRLSIFPALLLCVLIGGCRLDAQPTRLELHDLTTGRTLAGARILQSLRGVRLILMGEHHTSMSHHADQLRVIRFLDEQRIPIVIGLEMFRQNQQEALDRWVAGEIDEVDFEPIFLNNWNFPWKLYRDIFLYAREKKTPMVGLNVSGDITRRVASRGFASLSEEQRGELEGVTCNVTREYRDYIRSAFSAHDHSGMNFTHFCEAQLVWDAAMALHAVRYLENHPDRVMVLLAGSAHARKMGIPFQVRSRRPIPLAVLLPYTPKIFDPDTVTTAEADFLIMP